MFSEPVLPESLDSAAVANEWFRAFVPFVESADVARVLSLLTEDSFWRDGLALTWDLRTFDGPRKIKRLLDDRLKVVKLTNLRLGDPSLVNNSPVAVWIQSVFTFDIGDYGFGAGVVRLVPTSAGEWKAYTIYTSLSGLRDHPEQLGEHRSHLPDHGGWLERRQREMEFADEEPYALVVGAGHGGIHIAARLKHLGIPTLVVERNVRIGDNWRNRYDMLCLHDPVCRSWNSGIFLVSIHLDSLSIPQGTTNSHIYLFRRFGQPLPLQKRFVVWGRKSQSMLIRDDSLESGSSSTFLRSSSTCGPLPRSFLLKRTPGRMSGRFTFVGPGQTPQRESSARST
jgi:hypothetical protein